EQQFVQVYLDRAYFRTVTAQRRSIAEVFPFAQILEMGCDHRTDRPAVGGTVTVPADVLIDGACVETGAASDAIEAFSGFGIGEDIGTAVVEQDDDHFFR